MLAVAKSSRGTLDLNELLDRVQRQAAAVLGCDSVATFLLDSDDGMVRPVSLYGVPEQQLAAARAIALRPGQIDPSVLEDGHSFVLNDLARAPAPMRELLATFELEALVAAPLLVRGRYLGAFIAANRRGSATFNSEQVSLCEGIASHLAVAIESVESYREQQEQAHVAGVLAHVGQELISSLDTPVLLQRLCRLTAEALECDTSATILWDSRENVWRPMLFHGASPEDSALFEMLRLPPEMFSGILSLLRDADVEQVRVDQSPHPLVADLIARLEMKVILYMALRRGERIIGLQAACYRSDPGALTAKRRRMASGIAHLASLALENARLVEEVGNVSRLKSEFVATMSHELRTPLNIIIGYNDLMRERGLGPLTAAQQDATQRIEGSARNLLDLITATLDLSRLEAGQMPVEIQETRVADLIRSLQADLCEQQSKPNVQWIWDVEKALPLIRSDPLKLKVVLKNLLMNASKFTDRGSVTVSVHRQGDGVGVDVADTGIGIAPEILPIIFDPFRQGDGSMTRRHGGVGLGLYIARRLLQLLGGTISVDSEVGVGSTFHVGIPARPVACGVGDAVPSSAAAG